MYAKRPLWFVVLLSLSVMLSLLIAALCSLGSASSAPGEHRTPGQLATPATELRGVWLTNIDSDVLFSRAKLADALQKLDRLNFNTVYPTVWNWGYTLYPSSVAENAIGRAVDPEPGLRGRDMLEEIVEQGHALGMSVIPWFEFGFMAPADSDLAARHPEWIASRSDGSQIVKEGKHDRVWLNPFHPEVQEFIVDLIAEIVTNYDIDGIQLDDHFGLPVQLGYDPYTVQLYQMEHQGQSPPDNPVDPEWIRWRANKITGVMAQVFAAVKGQKPHAIVALSPNPQAFAYRNYLQDWFNWERRGFVEELILQVYRNDLDRFILELKRPEVQIAINHIPVAVGILTGLKNRPVRTELLQQQVQAMRSQGLAGVSFFFYETLWNLTLEKPAERQAAFRDMFPKPAARPSLLHCWRRPDLNQ
ncbi:MAG: family 10 glycosylhydrolase [Hormoscilla sp. GM102CHS1]|nr:family 10 glycosylhydrolase [Hormoscilla sp. GM102CHS1]